MQPNSSPNPLQASAPRKFDNLSKNGTIRFPRVRNCGHKFVPGREPRIKSCAPCWFAFFTGHPEIVKSAEEVMKDWGRQGLAQVRGRRFAQMYEHFSDAQTILMNSRGENAVHSVA